LKRYLKLTAGTFKGRKLYVPDIGVRPATNLVREAIFSVLNNILEGGIRDTSVIDLFAGTGSLGLEALSRGAKYATFVDNNQSSISSINKNLKLLGLKGCVIKSDVAAFLKRNRKSLEYDVIFFDPPYKYRWVEDVLNMLAEAIQEGKTSVLVYERSYDKILPEVNASFSLLKRKKYGQTEVLFYNII